jgi:hypothetical protein
MSTIIPYFDPLLGKLRNSDVALISLATLVVTDPLIVNNLIVNSNASINTLKTNAITNTSTISTNGLGLNFAQWNSNTSLGPLEGLMNWSSLYGTIQLGLAGGTVDVPLGLTTNLPKRVRNSTGSTMPKGTAVYLNGVSGNTPLVERALATGDRTSAFTIGMTAEDIANNATGWVTSFGLIRGVNTSSFTSGDTLYLSGATAGYYTNVPTKAPIHYVRVGTVTKASADGEIIVNVINGYELDELHNVIIASLASGQILQSGASSYWYNVNPAFIPTASYPSLGSLAVLNELSYYNLVSKPSLGSLAPLNELSYYALVSKPSLGSLAERNSLSYTELLNLPSLGSLAQQNNVNFYNLVSYPSLGSLSQLNSLSYYALDSRLSLGSLAVQNNLSYYSLDSRLSLGSLAVQNNLSYFSLDSRLSLGSLAVLNELSYASLTNLPSLGSLAVQNNLSYYSLDSRLSLGSLAVQNNLSYYSLDSRLSLGSLAVISNVASPLALSGPTLTILQPDIIHNNLGGLTLGDPHTQYALLAGRSGGQILHGGTAVDNTLILRGTSANGNTVTNNALRFGVGNGGGTYAMNIKHNGSVDMTTTTTTSANALTITENISGFSGDNIGAFFNITDSAGGIKTNFAHRARLVYSGATVLQGMQATSNQAFVSGGGTVNALEVLTSNLDVSNNSTVVDAKLIRLFAPTVITGGSIGTLMGLAIPALTQGTTNWSIYSEGGSMFHEGNILIGNTGYLSIRNGSVTAPNAIDTGDILTGTSAGIYQLDISTSQEIFQKSSTDAVGNFISFRKTRGTTTSPSVITAGDTAGTIRAYTYDGTNYDEITRIELESITVQNSGIIRFWTASAGTIAERLSINATGQITAANLAGTGTRYVYASNVGLLTATAAIPSDERLKKDIAPITGALDAVKQINGVTFKWKDEEAEGTETKVGFIAQNVMSVYPLLSAENADGYYGVKYNEFSALLVEAIKEQQVIIETLKSEVEILKGQING